MSYDTVPLDNLRQSPDFPLPVKLENISYTLLIQFESQDSVPFFTLTNKNSGNIQILCGYQYNSLMNDSLLNLFPEVARVFHNMRNHQADFLRSINNPIHLYPELIASKQWSSINANFPHINNPKVIYRKDQVSYAQTEQYKPRTQIKQTYGSEPEAILGMPELVWSHQPAYPGGNQNWDTISPDPAKKDSFGWRLGLHGVRDQHLYYASWDDTIGIKKLVEAMEDIKALHVAMTLLDSVRMGWLQESIKILSVK